MSRDLRWLIAFIVFFLNIIGIALLISGYIILFLLINNMYKLNFFPKLDGLSLMVTTFYNVPWLIYSTHFYCYE